MSSQRNGPGRVAAIALAASSVVAGILLTGAPAFAVGEPTVTAINVTKANSDGGTNILVTGTKFLTVSEPQPGDGASTVTTKLANVAIVASDNTATSVLDFLVISDTQLAAKLPAGTSDAVYDLVVTGSAGASAKVATDKVTYRSAVNASVASGTLMHPTVSGKLPVTVNLPIANTADITTKKITATINGTAAVATWVSTTGTTSSDTSVLSLAIPAGTPSSVGVPVVIFHDGVAGTTDTNAKYASVITLLSVTSGPSTANATGTIVVTGKGLTGATAWKIGTQDFTGTATAGPCVPTTTATADTSWTCTGIPAAPQSSAPADILGPVAVSFTSASGPFANTAAGTYTYTNLR
jgi:IPT/TIG domain